MSSYAVSLFNHADSFLSWVIYNFVYYIVRCGEDRMMKRLQDLLYSSKEKLPVTTVFGWSDVKTVNFTVLLYDGLRSEQSTVLRTIMTGRLIQIIL